MTIWKYTLDFVPNAALVVTVPMDAQPLCVQLQGGLPTLWCLVNPKNAIERKRFIGLFTGHEMPGTMRLGPHLGTVQPPSGLVYHFFELLHG